MDDLRTMQRAFVEGIWPELRTRQPNIFAMFCTFRPPKSEGYPEPRDCQVGLSFGEGLYAYVIVEDDEPVIRVRHEHYPCSEDLRVELAHPDAIALAIDAVEHRWLDYERRRKEDEEWIRVQTIIDHYRVLQNDDEP